MRLATLFLLLPALCFGSVSEPAIVTVTSEVAEGDTVTVTGVGFGTAPHIYMWDDFDADADGTAMNGKSPVQSDDTYTWYAGSSSVARTTVSNDRRVSGANSAKVIGEADPDYPRFEARFEHRQCSDNLGQMFVSFFRFDNRSPSDAACPTTSFKAWRWEECPGDVYPDLCMPVRPTSGYMAHGSNGAGDTRIEPGYSEYIDQNGTTRDISNTGDHPFTWSAIAGEWQRFEYFYDLNDVEGAPTATTLILHKLEHMYWNTTDTWIVSGDLPNSPFDAMRFCAGDYAGAAIDTHIVYWDDIYLADKMARIEVGDSENFWQCTKRDIQVPITWSDTEITFELRTPTVGTPDSMFVFIMDDASPYTWDVQYLQQTGGPAPTVPAAPTGGSAAAASDTEITVSWTDASSDEDGFRIYSSDASDGTFTLDGTAAADATSYTDDGLSAEETRHYRIYSYNDQGESATYATASATTNAAPASAPTAPTAGACTVLSAYSISFAWTDNSDNEDGFYIYRGLTRAGLAIHDSVAENVVSYTSTGLSPETEYHFQAWAYNQADTSATAAQDSATTVATPGVGAPGAVRIGCPDFPEIW